MTIKNAFDLYFNRPPVITQDGVAEGMRKCIVCLNVKELGMYHRNGKHPVTKKPRWRALCKDCYNAQVAEKARKRR